MFDVLIVVLGLIFLAVNIYMLIWMLTGKCGSYGDYGERVCTSHYSGWVILLIMTASIAYHAFILYLLSIVRDLLVVTSITNNSAVAKSFMDTGMDYMFREPAQPTSYDVIKERVIAEQEAQNDLASSENADGTESED